MSEEAIPDGQALHIRELDQLTGDPPQNVRLVPVEGGAEIPCTVVRAPELDKPGVTYWSAVPQSEPDSNTTYRVRCGVLPAHTGISVATETPGLFSMMEPLAHETPGTHPG